MSINAIFHSEERMRHRTAPFVARDEAILERQMKVSQGKEAEFFLSKDAASECWRSPDPDQYIIRYSKKEVGDKSHGLRHKTFDNSVNPQLLPAKSHDSARDTAAKAIAESSPNFLLKKLSTKESYRSCDPEQFAKRYEKPSHNPCIFPARDSELTKIDKNNIGGDTLGRPRGKAQPREIDTTDPRLYPKQNTEQMRDEAAKKFQESNAHMFARKLTEEHWRNPAPEQFEKRYAKENFSLFEKFGSFPLDKFRGKQIEPKLDDNLVKQCFHDGAARKRQEDVDKFVASPSKLNSLSTKGDRFAQPNTAILVAMELSSRPNSFGRKEHGMFDGVMAKSDVPTGKGKQMNINRAGTSLEGEKHTVLGFPREFGGKEQHEKFHPDNWKLNKNFVDTDPMGVKRPGHLDIPKIREINKLKHPYAWVPIATEALQKNNDAVLDRLCPERAPVVRTHVHQLPPRTHMPTEGLLGFGTMGKVSPDIPITGKKRLTAEGVRENQRRTTQ